MKNDILKASQPDKRRSLFIAQKKTLESIAVVAPIEKKCMKEYIEDFPLEEAD